MIGRFYDIKTAFYAPSTIKWHKDIRVFFPHETLQYSIDFFSPLRGPKRVKIPTNDHELQIIF